MKHIHIALFCFSLALPLHFHPLNTTLPDHSEVYNGTKYYGTPEQIHYVKQVSDLVDHFDQEIFGTDTPRPKTLVLSENLYVESKKVLGLAHVPTSVIKLEMLQTPMELYKTLFHERLHLAGLGSDQHPYIRQLEGALERFLISWGY